MKVKKYVVDSLPIAMGKIKKELGNDAIILHTKKVKVGGFFGFFGKEKMEVIAAVDNHFSNSMVNPPLKKRDEGLKSTVDYSSTLDSFSENTQSKPHPSIESKKTEIHDSNKGQSLSSEVGELKNLLLKVLLNQNNEAKHYKKDLQDVYERLITQGVKDDVATSLIGDTIKAINEQEDVNILQEVEKLLTSKLDSIGEHKSIGNQVKIVNFVGPTGVGKTTTIAKLAAEKALKEKKKVAFITADTYRIGAVDQLKIYAEILNAPVEVVFTPQDIQKIIDKLSDYDLIFMDTAGRNYSNDMYISELNNIISKVDHCETYLVISLTHKYEDTINILDQFNKIKVDKILFTKFDETMTYGNILNIVTNFPYKVSYIANGQNVPDDIEVFNGKKVAKAILGVN